MLIPLIRNVQLICCSQYVIAGSEAIRSKMGARIVPCLVFYSKVGENSGMNSTRVDLAKHLSSKK
jgi:hypothetical protein